MSSEIADMEETAPSVPMRAALAQAQHLSRYRWAGVLCASHEVLEVGCGDGRGCAILLAEGARQVVGVDHAQAVIDAAAPTMPQGVRLVHCQPGRLPLEDRRFQAVVWFDPLPYVGQLAAMLDEVRRVLASDGLLIVAWPNREITLPGGRGDRHVFQPGHLLSAVREQFPHVRLFRQTDWTASAIVDDETFAAAGDAALPELVASKLNGARPGAEAYTLAVASSTSAAFPAPRATAVFAHLADGADWLDRFEKQQTVIRRHLERIAELEQVRHERDELRRELRAREQGLSAEMNAAIHELEQQMTLVLGSTSWRLTAPLRKVTKPLRDLAAIVRAVRRRLRAGAR